MEKKVFLIANGKLCGEEESLRELQRLAAKGKQGAFLPENRRKRNTQMSPSVPILPGKSTKRRWSR